MNSSSHDYLKGVLDREGQATIESLIVSLIRRGLVVGPGEGRRQPERVGEPVADREPEQMVHVLPVDRAEIIEPRAIEDLRLERSHLALCPPAGRHGMPLRDSDGSHGLANRDSGSGLPLAVPVRT